MKKLTAIVAMLLTYNAVAMQDGPLRLCASTARPGVTYQTNVECPYGTELDRTAWTGAWQKSKPAPRQAIDVAHPPSRQGHRGPCRHPDDIAADGKRCGNRAASVQ